MGTKLKNDATLKQLGNIYQYIIALECCLDAKEGESIWIETYGDVSDGKTQREIKHHIEEEHKLTDRHPDFWKTLKNWVENFKTYEEYKFLILLTTSIVEKDSNFSNWNDLDSNKKLDLLEKIIYEKTTDTIKPFIDVIFSYNSAYTQNDLLHILERFRINHSNERINGKIKEISNHPTFNTIPKKNREQFIYILLSKILRYGVNNQKNWEIDISNFKNFLISQTKYYCDVDIPLPTLFKYETTDVDTYKDRRFVKEINKIDYQKVIPEAINDYHRASKTTILLCDNSIDFVEAINEYQNDLHGDLKYIKEKHTLECKDIDIKKIQNQSKLCYNDCMLHPLKNIKGILINDDFFQRGTIQIIVEEKDFSWLIISEG